MPRIGIELNNVCNLDCTHCFRGIYRGDPEENKDLFLPLDLLDKILREAAPLGYRHVAITGGEPPMHPRFGEALDIIAGHGLTCHFLTNARNFQKTLKAISVPRRKAKLKGISFSLDGATEATHDKIRGKGSYKEVVTAIAACQAVGIEASIITTINRANRHEIDQLALLGAHLKVKQQLFGHQTPTEHNLDHDLILPVSEWRAVERDVARVMGEFRHQIGMAMGFYTDYYLPRCAPLSLEDLNVDYRGRLTLCCQLSNYRDLKGDGMDVIGDLRRTSLPELLSQLMDLINRVHKERLEMAADPERADQLHYPCLVCIDRFRKTSAEPMMVQLSGLDSRKIAAGS
ncbi:MAG TPA: radical SAM protein [Blastocatellia bacterium]|nr:radical SAM protein [Blastocatellia bacterium]